MHKSKFYKTLQDDKELREKHCKTISVREFTLSSTELPLALAMPKQCPSIDIVKNE